MHNLFFIRRRFGEKKGNRLIFGILVLNILVLFLGGVLLILIG
jgi:hypothetical protein